MGWKEYEVNIQISQHDIYRIAFDAVKQFDEDSNHWIL